MKIIKLKSGSKSFPVSEDVLNKIMINPMLKGKYEVLPEVQEPEEVTKLRNRKKKDADLEHPETN